MKGKINWDALGIATSLACAIHCAILPLMLGSLPIMGINLVNNEGFEYFMIFLAFGIGTYSLWHGFRRHHHSFLPLAIFFSGITLLVAKQVWHNWQLLLLPLAVVFIIAAHVLNYRSCRIHAHARRYR